MYRCLGGWDEIFPPSFFDIITHLLTDLVDEANIVGLVQYCWMYPIERYLHRLKSCKKLGSSRKTYC